MQNHAKSVRNSDLYDWCMAEKNQKFTLSSLDDALWILKRIANDADAAKPSNQRLFVNHEYAKRFPFGIWFRGEPQSATPLEHLSKVLAASRPG